MADLLRAARIRPGFCAAAEVHLVETSPRLRAVQKATLAAGSRHAGTTRIADAAAGPGDHRRQRVLRRPAGPPVRPTDAGWAERMVGLDADGRPRLRPPSAPPAPPAPRRRPRRAPSSRSRRPRRPSWRRSPGASPRDGGALLAIDYGYDGPGFGDTLQAVRGHHYADPLAAPGEADLTAHVDFAALADARRKPPAPAPAAARPGRLPPPPRHRRARRAARRRQGRGDRRGDRRAVRRLAAPEAMGRLFKVLAYRTPGLRSPPSTTMLERKRGRGVATC